MPVEREVGLADGSWFLARLLPYRTVEDKIAGVVVSFINITDQKRAAEALRSSEERLRMVVENATEYAIFSTDLERRVTIWNSGAQRLLGYAESEVLGRPADIIFTDEDRVAGAPEQEMETAAAEGRAGDDRMHQRKDGSRFWASGALMLMRDAQGQAVGFVKILRDQTAARETQQALERSQADLLRALAENEKARAGTAGRRRRQGPFPGGAVARAAQSAGLDRQRGGAAADAGRCPPGTAMRRPRWSSARPAP